MRPRIRTRIEPRRHLRDVRGRADAPERRRGAPAGTHESRGGTRARLAGQHRQQRPVVLSQMDADAGVARPQAERALGAQQPVQIRDERVAISRERPRPLVRSLATAEGRIAARRVVEPRGVRNGARRSRTTRSPRRSATVSYLAALAAAQLDIDRAGRPSVAAVRLGPNQPSDLRLGRRRVGRDGMTPSRARFARAATATSGASSSRTPRRHEAPVRLPAVGPLVIPKWRFALEKARDEVSVGVRKVDSPAKRTFPRRRIYARLNES